MAFFSTRVKNVFTLIIIIVVVMSQISRVVKDRAGRKFRELVLETWKQVQRKWVSDPETHVIEVYTAYRADCIDVFHRFPDGKVIIYQVSRKQIEGFHAIAVCEQLDDRETLLIQTLYAQRKPKYQVVLGENTQDIHQRLLTNYGTILPAHVIDAIAGASVLGTLYVPGEVVLMQQILPHHANWHRLWENMLANE